MRHIRAGFLKFHRSLQPVSSIAHVGFASRRNNARAPLYLAAKRVFSHPLITALPDESKTRHPHVDRPRFLITTSSIKNRSAVGQIGSIGISECAGPWCRVNSSAPSRVKLPVGAEFVLPRPASAIRRPRDTPI